MNDMRYLFFLLLTLNVAFFLWSVRSAMEEPLKAVSEAQPGKPQILLASEAPVRPKAAALKKPKKNKPQAKAKTELKAKPKPRPKPSANSEQPIRQPLSDVKEANKQPVAKTPKPKPKPKQAPLQAEQDGKPAAQTLLKPAQSVTTTKRDATTAAVNDSKTAASGQPISQPKQAPASATPE